VRRAGAAGGPQALTMPTGERNRYAGIPMKRTTLKIPDALDARLRHEAERRGMTMSEVSREALEAYLMGPAGRRRLGAAGAGRSGRSDVSERIEEILAAEVPR
jgi:Ribbon-helix-helix protein, copG family